MGEITDTTVLLPALAVIPGHVFWRASARVGVLADRLLSDEVDLTSYAALHALPGATAASQQAVGDTIAVSRTTMAKVAADLVASGFVERVRNPDDRRSYLLSRTPAGAATLGRWDREVATVDEAVLSPFDAEEGGDLHRLLLRLAEALLPPDLPAAVSVSVALLVVRVHACLYREFATLLAPLDLEPRHVGALAALTALGPVPQAELARAIGTSPASVVVIADELEDRGLVSRRRAPTDRRTQVLHLADRAPAVLAAAHRDGGAAAARFFAALPAGGLERLLDLLRRLVTAA